MAVLSGIFLRAFGFLMSLILMWAAPPPQGEAIEPVDKDNLQLQFSVIADTHMTMYEFGNIGNVAKVLQDMAASQPQQDALVLVGDNGGRSGATNYITLYGLLSRYNRAANTLLAVGNHDLDGCSLFGYGPQERHRFFYQSYTGVKIDKPYYSRVINGYTFVVLGSEFETWPMEGEDAPRAYISEAQLEWLEETIDAAGAGKPVFVFMHQTLNHLHDWGGAGEQSEDIRDILESYSNIVIFNGHMHDPPGMRKIDGVHYVNVPACVQRADNGTYYGVGFQVEAYADRVVLRARNFNKSEWLADKEYTITL